MHHFPIHRDAPLFANLMGDDLQLGASLVADVVLRVTHIHAQNDLAGNDVAGAGPDFNLAYRGHQVCLRVRAGFDSRDELRRRRKRVAQPALLRQATCRGVRSRRRGG